ncbi:protein C34G6.1 [Aphelenchoides avenae]|nr:protein C34G6.1 [Aphelenchus avenae]
MAHNLGDLIIALFDCVSSTTQPEARESIAESLGILGNKQPGLFLSSAHAFLVQQSKAGLSAQNRAFVLSSIQKVLEKQNVLEDCDEQQALLIINLAAQEMTMTKDSDEEWANAAKDVLVSMAKHGRFVGHVMDALLQKFPPGLTVPPHRYVILALAAVAQHNAFGFVPFLTDILSRAVPLLSHLRHDAIKAAWSQALCSFCESVIEFSAANKYAKPTKEASEDDEPVELAQPAMPALQNGLEDVHENYSDQMESAYDVVSAWVYAKDSKCRADATECIGTLCLMISRERINRDLKKLVTMFLALYKKTTSLDEQCAVTRGITNFLQAACADEALPVEHYLDDIFNTLFPHVCTVTEQSLTSEGSPSVSPKYSAIKIRNEAYRCFQVASGRFADRQVYYLLHKMQNEKSSVKLGAINLMRHLLNSASK